MKANKGRQRTKVTMLKDAKAIGGRLRSVTNIGEIGLQYPGPRTQPRYAKGKVQDLI